ncbi:MAG: tRNA (adenosine(37)-N6)-threonylcarbamoyltransferase complex dimerization subunit type 1 TsaB [Chitinophagales bacterium]
MANILCIETANAITSIAISEHGKCVHAKHILESNKATDNLHILTEALLKEASLSFQQIDAIAISSGPGSYTGLRIAAAAAKGFCFSLNIPLIAIPTLESMVVGAINRYHLNGFDFYFPMIDARRMEVFTTIFSKEIEIEKTFSSLIINDDFKNLLNFNKKYLVFGNGAAKIKSIIDFTNITIFEGFTPSSEDLCLLAFQRYLRSQFEDIAYFEPNYYKAFYSTYIK